MQEIILRPYQKEGVAETIAHWQFGKDEPDITEVPKVCLVLPTGAGKGTMGEFLMRSFRRPVVVTHTDTLRTQMAERIPFAKSVTIQACLADGKKGDALRLELQEADGALFDECHHYPSGEFRKGFGLMPNARFVGTTATPVRRDGTPLGDVFDVMVAPVNYSDLISQGYLVPMHVWRPEIRRAEQEVLNVRIDAVQAYLSHGREGREAPPKTLWFGSDVKECQLACKRLKKEGGVIAHTMHAKTPKARRLSLIKAFRAGEIEVLASPVLLSEGFDVPASNTVVVDRSAGHIALAVQMYGRGLRSFPGKTESWLIDPRDTVGLHGHPTADREYSLTGKPMSLKKSKKRLADEDREKRENLQREQIESAFQVALDSIADRFAAHLLEAKRRGFNPGWAAKQLHAECGVKPPLQMFSKSRVTCVECRHYILKGELKAWTDSGESWHNRCWFEAMLREAPTAKQWAGQL